jgi:hypothetical protein
VIFTKSYLGYQIEEDKVGGICSARGKGKCVIFWRETMKGKVEWRASARSQEIYLPFEKKILFSKQYGISD